jgi:hypothetical protein
MMYYIWNYRAEKWDKISRAEHDRLMANPHRAEAGIRLKTKRGKAQTSDSGKKLKRSIPK